MKRIILLYISALILAVSCSGNKHFISDEQYRTQVEADFSARESILVPAGVDLDAMGLSADEKEALQFLYAYMPLGDIVNQTPEYYLQHYLLTKQARDEMSWGASVPERELRHFVLPVRVNNENLDSSRVVFFNELAPRIKDMSMRDAVLEVNHWCHENAVYMPSDRRTSSPLATIKTAYGRCGEESTLLVAALRAVGIPARQVYTPRWAHTDSNHAWVEAWVDGQWYFLGACEPEPGLCNHSMRIQLHYEFARCNTRADRALLDIQHTQRGNDECRTIPIGKAHTHSRWFTHSVIACQPYRVRFRNVYDTLLFCTPGVRSRHMVAYTGSTANTILGTGHTGMLLERSCITEKVVW